MGLEFPNEKIKIKEKEEKWVQMEQKVERIGDKLGFGIDKEIKFPVISLKVNGFGTTGSCEGHLDRAYPWPWVQVESNFAEELLSNPEYLSLKERFKIARKNKETLTEDENTRLSELFQKQIAENEKTYLALFSLLEEYYSDINEEKAVRLGIQKGPWNQSQLQPENMPRGKVEDVQRIWGENLNEEEKIKKLQQYRKEMNQFAEFLKQKFFKEEAEKMS
jgi:hypothetical protein